QPPDRPRPRAPGPRRRGGGGGERHPRTGRPPPPARGRLRRVPHRRAPDAGGRPRRRPRGADPSVFDPALGGPRRAAGTSGGEGLRDHQHRGRPGGGPGGRGRGGPGVLAGQPAPGGPGRRPPHRPRPASVRPPGGRLRRRAAGGDGARGDRSGPRPASAPRPRAAGSAGRPAAAGGEGGGGRGRLHRRAGAALRRPGGRDPPRHARRRRRARRHRAELRLDAGAGRAREGLLPDAGRGPQRRQRPSRADRGPPRRRRRLERRRVRARPQGRREGSRVRGRGAGGGEVSAARPDAQGHFGPYGGRFVPETLMEPLRELEAAWLEARRDPAFREDLAGRLRDYVGRPTPLTFASRLSDELGCRVWLKREDLCHTGAHKINNALGQALLVKRMGKTRVVAETGAGQHGVATATVCALLGLECVVYMGTEDMARQAPNVRRMRLLGAEVRPVEGGSRTLKDAINEAMRDWVTNVRTTHYLLGSVLGAHPYPAMVRDFHAVIGEEARSQVRSQAGALPDVLVACVGGGSNALGLFAAFFGDPVEMVGVEAGGRSPRPGDHAARFLNERGGAVARPPGPP